MAEGQYQNGGQWDWWGGLQITAEFERGLRLRALEHLKAVASDWAKHPRDIYEWQMARAQENRGANYYGGSVATMNEAVIRGLFGVTVEASGVTLAIRLAEQPGWIRVNVPASGQFVSYRYTVEGARQSIAYESNHPRPIAFRVATPIDRIARRVTVDGAEVPYTLERLNEDDYAVFSAPSGTHSVEITLALR